MKTPRIPSGRLRPRYASHLGELSMNLHHKCFFGPTKLQQSIINLLHQTHVDIDWCKPTSINYLYLYMLFLHYVYIPPISQFIHGFYNVVPPVISWSINPMNTIVISTINHSEIGVIYFTLFFHVLGHHKKPNRVTSASHATVGGARWNLRAVQKDSAASVGVEFKGIPGRCSWGISGGISWAKHGKTHGFHGIYRDFMGFNGDFMGFNGDLMGFNRDLMGSNGI